MMLLKFESLHKPVQLAQGLKVLPHLMKVFAAWPYREIPRNGNPDALINVFHEDGGYRVEAPWLHGEIRFESAAQLAQVLASHVARGWFMQLRGILWLEASAVLFGNQAVVLVGGPSSGKSLLAVGLAVGGNPVFADRILPVWPEEQKGMALGLAPCLELPLPAELRKPLRSAMTEQADSGSAGNAFLRADGGMIASFGETANIRAFVMLDRSVSQAATFSEASGGKLIKRLLLNSFGKDMAAETLLQKVQNLVDDVPCYRLAWSDPKEAVNALRARFVAWRVPKTEIEEHPRSSRKPKTRRRTAGPRAPAGRQFRHRQGLTERLVDSDLFLVGPGGQTIYHLNGLGAGIWRLLEGAHGFDDVVTVLRQAYPEVDPDSIEGDVTTLVKDLCDRGLLVEKVS